MTVITITPSPTVDFSVEVPALVPDRKIRSHMSAFHPGGGGVNVSRVLHDLELDTTAVVTAGGLPGEIVLDRLAALGIDTMAIATRADTRWAQMLLDRSTNSEYRLITEASTLDEAEWKACISAVADLAAAREHTGRYVVLSGSMQAGVPDRFVRGLASTAAQHSLPLIVDTSGPALVTAVEEQVHLIKPSRGELATLVGVSPADLDHVAAAHSLVARGVEVVVVSLGPDGAFVATADDEAHFRLPDLPVVTTVGAGDSMVAGIVAGLTEERSVVDAVRLGVALGSATCLTPAGHSADPNDIERLDATLVADRTSLGR